MFDHAHTLQKLIEVNRLALFLDALYMFTFLYLIGTLSLLCWCALTDSIRTSGVLLHPMAFTPGHMTIRVL